VDFLRNIDIAEIAIQFVVLLFSLSIHEASHAWMADHFGDNTARYLGRVTVNPIPHIDPIGTILFPILMFFTHIPIIGWAKPVPVNHAHLRNPRKDNIWISLAGPGANLLAGLSALVLLLIVKLVDPGLIAASIGGVRGSAPAFTPAVLILYYLVVINFALAIFNCIPIPPLDGHWVLYGLLPDSAADMLRSIGGYGFLILYALMFMGVLDYLFIPIYMVIGLVIR
jgi:Zn-dependent protease